FLKTVEVMARDDVVTHLWNYGAQLKQQLNALARTLGIDRFFAVDGLDCSPYFVTKDAQGQVSLAYRTLFLQEMIRAGVLMPWLAISFSHGPKQLEQTLAAAEKALTVYRRALESGVEGLLQGPAIKPVFRRVN